MGIMRVKSFLERIKEENEPNRIRETKDLAKLNRELFTETWQLKVWQVRDKTSNGI